MRLRYKIASAGLLVLAAAIGVALVALSHTSPCGAAAPFPAGTPAMKAVVRRCYGGPDVLALEDVPKPRPAESEVLVRIHAASINPLEWHEMRGEPYLIRLDEGIGAPTSVVLGVDYAGTVEAVGRNVTRFKPGDEVFGGSGRGTLAEYVSVSAEGAIARKPANMSFEQAAAVPVAALTALQALRDEGQLHAGQKVLINGASGGVGTFAVQIAKALGAEVTGVCSTRNLELVRSIGADHVVDYTREDVTRGSERYDLIVDNVATHSLLDYRRVMQPHARLVIVGSTDRGPWLGPLEAPVKAMVLSQLVSQQAGMFISSLNPKDLGILAALMQSGRVTPVIDRRYGLHEIASAMRYLELGHAHGKVVITVP